MKSFVSEKLFERYDPNDRLAFVLDSFDLLVLFAYKKIETLLCTIWCLYTKKILNGFHRSKWYSEENCKGFANGCGGRQREDLRRRAFECEKIRR